MDNLSAQLNNITNLIQGNAVQHRDMMDILHTIRLENAKRDEQLKEVNKHIHGNSNENYRGLLTRTGRLEIAIAFALLGGSTALVATNEGKMKLLMQLIS